jgi:hypothetical protein
MTTGWLLGATRGLKNNTVDRKAEEAYAKKESMPIEALDVARTAVIATGRGGGSYDPSRFSPLLSTWQLVPERVRRGYKPAFCWQLVPKGGLRRPARA